MIAINSIITGKYYYYFLLTYGINYFDCNTTNVRNNTSSEVEMRAPLYNDIHLCSILGAPPVTSNSTYYIVYNSTVLCIDTYSNMFTTQYPCYLDIFLVKFTYYTLLDRFLCFLLFFISKEVNSSE